MDGHATLKTDRLVLLPLADEHVELELELDSDPEVLRYLGGRARSREEVIASHERRMQLTARIPGLGFWIAFSAEGLDGGSPRRADGFVGLIMLPPAHGPDQPDDPDVADLGYRLRRRYWRRGLAGEACRAVLTHGFETVGIQRVIAQTRIDNAPSRALLRTLGMRMVRSYVPAEDESAAGMRDVEYELTRDDWRRRSTR
ncbi:GNAT family N-acetyltransferase [Agromyces aurantiacus]|uniref:GNAT family N-acetyltransferase n=1 Tax=Agromyces aurantiacus TaxID=165814 RepID=A0ABV9R8W1_9MICO|nr:GNAT family N-acetyltransferase [Agromyces aurantiacus]MBM7505281.1 RimJ/RimL family protein N-acetyltransferase [Agromyces aurantiacus]